MKISVDAAALCDKTNKYGNYVVTRNIAEAIKRQDKKNEYMFYSFCKKPSDLELSNNQRYRRILPRKFWLSSRVSFEEIFNPKDIFLALNQATPLFTKSRIFSLSHGMSFYFFKDLYQDSYETLKDQLFTMISKSENVFVSSRRVKEEIDSIFLKQKKVRIIPYGIPYDMITTSLDSEEISQNVRESAKDFFLYVGMNHPIKNIQFLIDAFKIFSQNRLVKNYKLLLVGADFDYLKEQGLNMKNLKSVNRSELKYLFQKASGYVSASKYESFNFPVLEALSQDCPVVARTSAVIPELQKYTHIADHVEEFVEFMKLCAARKTRKIQKEHLKKEFSWDQYLSKLLTYY